MKAKVTWLFLLIVSCTFGQELNDNQLKIGTEYSISSKILNEERSYIVALPKSYKVSSANYPVMVVTDGDYRFLYTSGIIEFLSKQNEMPEAIIVAIPNSDRTRDLTPTSTNFNNMGGGGAQDFLKFIETELMPEVDRRFRTHAYRVLAGHSLGGLFAGYSYMTNSSFSGYIASDPSFWWDNQYVVNLINNDIAEQVKNKKIYVSSADNYERNEGMLTFMRNAQELFCARLKQYGVAHSNIKLDYFENEDHGTSAYMSWYNGLKFIFRDFMLNDIYNKTADQITEHYKALSVNIEQQFLPPEYLISKIAEYKLMGGNDENGAIALLELNAKNYPSSNNFKTLGDAYKTIGKMETAEVYYTKAHELKTLETETSQQRLKVENGNDIYLQTINHTINSKILKEDRTYSIGLPPSYDSAKHGYPILLILDGHYHLHHVMTTMEVMSKEGQIPEMIVVAVNTKEHRTRDLSPTKSLIGYDGKDNSQWQETSGGGHQFLEFLEQEILPEVKKKYRTKDYAIFVGHSLGGLLAAEAYLDNSAFNSYIAMDPSFWWDNRYVVNKIDTALTKKRKNRRFYFSGAGSYEKTNGMIANMRINHELFIATLKNSNVSHKNVKFDVFEDENHNSVPLISLYHGLLFIFQDYVLEDISNKSLQDIQQHYKALSNNLGVSFLPPEQVINRVAWAKFNNNEREEAYRLFQLNIENYPTSKSVYEMLGYAYNNAGKTEEALTYFKKSLEYNSNENEIRRITQLIFSLEN
ncbi:alpha/beta hydrolase-fold protein [Winogradskyella sp.]|uniref:alpha/beta hydrolase-fold protein n=2 Tax=Winogradskyella sp. TaxID=1883156 RepID=UPI003517B82D